MPTVTAKDLQALVREVLLAAGASENNADIVAEHLVLANLSGVDTHGVCQVPRYVEGLRQGRILGDSSPEVLQQEGSSALVTGHWSFGQVAALYAVQVAIEIALDRGMAAVGLVQCDHIGRLGHFTEVAADAGCISQVWAGGYSKAVPATMPYGGRERLLHTNPVSMAFPGGTEPTVVFDFATTTVSGMKVDNARRRGEQVQSGGIVDRMGRPTTDPSDFFDGGGHVPFGGHKGYALSMATEFFSHLFVGSSRFADSERGSTPDIPDQAVTFILLRDDLLRPRADYRREADEMERRTRAVLPAEGFTSVLVPGDPERRARNERRLSGIPIEDSVWEALSTLPR